LRKPAFRQRRAEDGIGASGSIAGRAGYPVEVDGTDLDLMECYGVLKASEDI
jgi:hypothetical protein